MATPSSGSRNTELAEPRRTALLRRLVTVSAVFICFGLSLATAPVWMVIAAGIDLAARGKRSALRCAGFLFWYLACEAFGLIVIGLFSAVRLLGHDTFLAANAWLQIAWAGWLYRGARLTFGVRLETEGSEVLEHGPYLLLLRHATIVDTLIPTLMAERPYGNRLRYVLKSELLWDPCLDIVGSRMGHYFAQRGTGETKREVDRVARLGTGLGPSDGVLIYPEGTRFSEAKRQRILARLDERGDHDRLGQALRLRHVLPPKVEGVLGLLEAAPRADVVLCAHVGLEETASFGDLWTGAAVGRVLQARFWRVPRAEIPESRSDRIAWLGREWQRVDDWIEEHRTS